jgi:hypothetical protein
MGGDGGMSTSLFDLRDNMKDEIALYKTPKVYTDSDYDKIIKKAAKRYYTDIGKANSWKYEFVDGATPILTIDLTPDQEEYIEIWGQILFIDQIKRDVAKLVSYSTDALSVTQGDKPYKNLSEDRQNLKNRLLELFYKFPGVSTMTPVTSLDITELDITYD